MKFTVSPKFLKKKAKSKENKSYLQTELKAYMMRRTQRKKQATISILHILERANLIWNKRNVRIVYHIDS